MHRIKHYFSNRGIRGQNFEQFKTVEPNSRLTYELQELTTDCAIQLRSSRTEYVSATNLNICQFVAIRGIRGLCGIGVLGVNQVSAMEMTSKFNNSDLRRSFFFVLHFEHCTGQ